MLGKKSQVAETTTWLVATVLILVILSVSIFAASSVAKVNHRIDGYGDENLLLKNSLYSYLVTKDENGNTTLGRIEASGNFDEFTSDLGRTFMKKIGKELSLGLRIREGSEVYYIDEPDSEILKILERNILGNELNLEIVNQLCRVC